MNWARHPTSWFKKKNEKANITSSKTNYEETTSVNSSKKSALLSTSDVKNRTVNNYGGLVNSTQTLGVFNQSLVEITKNGTEIPLVLKDCCGFVERNGLNVQGIYRVSGHISKMNYIKGEYHNGRRVDFEKNDYNVHTVAGVLKSFIREQERLIPSTNELVIQDLATIKDKEIRKRELTSLIRSIPKSHFICLDYIMNHLGSVAEKSTSNCMTVENLSLVFFPSTDIPAVLLSDMISFHDEIFSFDNVSNESKKDEELCL